MGGFTIAWFVALAIGIGIAGLGHLLPETAKPKFGKFLLGTGCILVLVAVVGLGRDAYLKYIAPGPAPASQVPAKPPVQPEKKETLAQAPKQKPKPKRVVHKKPKPSKSVSAKGPNSGAVGSVTQGPGSITQIGGNNNSATVNNFGPPDRHISPVQRAAIVSYLTGKTCAIQEIGMAFDAIDGQEYANEIRRAFKAGGCHVPTDLQLISFGGTGPEARGIVIEWHMNHGYKPGGRVPDPQSPPGVIFGALRRAGVRCCTFMNDAQLGAGKVAVLVGRR